MSASEPEIFAALGDKTRLHLVSRLSDGSERHIHELTSPMSMSRQAVTKHLKVLERAGLVSVHKVGRESRYRLQPDGFSRAQAYLGNIAAQWDRVLERLKLHVED